MGMFDTINVDLDHLKGSFQTKDLECTLDQYLVNKDGIHIHRNNKYYKVPWITGPLEIYEYNRTTKELNYHTLTFNEGDILL